VHPEEIPQAHEGSNRLDISGGFGVLDGFEFIFAWFDPIWSKPSGFVRVKPRYETSLFPNTHFSRLILR
jgi:hypothetical protein